MRIQAIKRVFALFFLLFFAEKLKKCTTKLDELARKQHLSRNEYLKKIVSRCAVVQDVIDLDKKYADLVNVLAERLEQAADVIATNTEILEKIIGGHF